MMQLGKKSGRPTDGVDCSIVLVVSPAQLVVRKKGRLKACAQRERLSKAEALRGLAGAGERLWVPAGWRGSGKAGCLGLQERGWSEREWRKGCDRMEGVEGSAAIGRGAGRKRAVAGRGRSVATVAGGVVHGGCEF